MYESHANLTLSIENKIATLTFFHPASNSFTTQMLNDLTAHVNDLSQNDSVNVVVLKSRGESVFCAGASFDELSAITDLETGTQFFSGFANVINAMRICSKLIVAQVQGKAVGGGVGLISACDYVFATTQSDIKLSEISIGIGPFVIEPAITRKIGISFFSQLALHPNSWQTANWALNHGLYSQVFNSAAEMEGAVATFLTKMTSYPTQSLLEMKKVLWQNTAHWDTLLYQRAEISGKLALSDYTKNLISQFKK